MFTSSNDRQNYVTGADFDSVIMLSDTVNVRVVRFFLEVMAPSTGKKSPCFYFFYVAQCLPVIQKVASKAPKPNFRVSTTAKSSPIGAVFVQSGNPGEVSCCSAWLVMLWYSSFMLGDMPSCLCFSHLVCLLHCSRVSNDSTHSDVQHILLPLIQPC